MANQFKTFMLLSIMTMFIIFVGQILGGRQGMIIAFIFAAGMNFFSYWFSDKMVLKMYRASEISPNEAPDIYEMVKTLAKNAHLPMPKIYLIPEDAPNAFATGRNPDNAVVAVTQGLIRLMDKNEVMGVLAHELAHIKNRDILIGTIAATMAGAIMMLASMARWSAIFGVGSHDDDDGGAGFIGVILVSIIAPIAAMIIQMAISRSREYLADETGAQFMGTPEGLASALQKLGAYSGQIPMNAKEATAHMFIANPLSGKSISTFFSTHPPIEERVARLRGVTSSPSQTKKGGMSKEAEDFWNKLS